MFSGKHLIWSPHLIRYASDGFSDLGGAINIHCGSHANHRLLGNIDVTRCLWHVEIIESSVVTQLHHHHPYRQKWSHSILRITSIDTCCSPLLHALLRKTWYHILSLTCWDCLQSVWMGVIVLTCWYAIQIFAWCFRLRHTSRQHTQWDIRKRDQNKTVKHRLEKSNCCVYCANTFKL